MRTLGTSIPFHDDETIMSFVSRVGLANFSPNTREFCLHMGLSFRKIMSGELDEIQSLFSLAGLPNATVGARNVVREGNEFLINGERLSKSCFQSHRFRYCPFCLADDVRDGEGPFSSRPYVRLDWHVTLIRSCPKHGTLLTLGGPAHRYGPRQIAAIIEDVDDGRLPITAWRRTKFESYISDRLWGRNLKCDWVDQMPLYVAGKLSEILGATILFGKHFIAKNIENEDWANCAQVGFDLIKEGEDAFREYIRSLPGEYWRGGKHLDARSLYGRIYVRLAHETHDPAYDGVRQIIREVGLQHLPFGPSDTLFGPIDERRLHSIQSASRQFGLEPSTVREVFTQANVIPPMCDSLADDCVLVAARTAEELIQSFERGRSAYDAQQYLGVDHEELMVLVELGYLNPQIERDETGPKYYFHKDDLDALIRKLLAAKGDHNESKKTLTLLSTAATISGCSFRVLVRMLFTNHLETVLLDQNDPRFANALVDADEVAALSRSLDQVSLPFYEAERAMGIPSQSLANLVARGIISSATVMNQTKRRFERVVSLTEMEAFECRYTTIYKYARATGRSVGEARDEIAAHGITAVTSIEEHGVALYNRTDLPV